VYNNTIINWYVSAISGPPGHRGMQIYKESFRMFIITLRGATSGLRYLSEDTVFSSPGFRNPYARYELRMCVCLPLDTSNPFKNRATVTNLMLVIYSTGAAVPA
jgi:hypothetical protein